MNELMVNYVMAISVIQMARQHLENPELHSEADVLKEIQSVMMHYEQLLSRFETKN